MRLLGGESDPPRPGGPHGRLSDRAPASWLRARSRSVLTNGVRW
jgi:hypothetical protein